MVTTTSIAASSGTQMTTNLEWKNDRINEIWTSTNKALSTYFPSLLAVPNITTYCMNIWNAESNFTNWPNGYNSRHFSQITSGNLYTYFWLDPFIKNAIAMHPNNSSFVATLQDGLYAHGVSAVMGAYHIQNSKAYRELFGSATYNSIAIANGLIVQPGTPVTSIYTEDQPGRYRNIVAGLIVLDSKFQAYSNKPLSSSSVDRLAASGDTSATVSSIATPKQAILLSAGAYLGWGTDPNGATGIGRMIQVNQGTSASWAVAASASGRNVSSAGNPQSKTAGCV